MTQYGTEAQFKERCKRSALAVFVHCSCRELVCSHHLDWRIRNGLLDPPILLTREEVVAREVNR